MYLRSLFSAIVGPVLIATRAICAVDSPGAIALFNGLQAKAEEVRTAANNLPALACIGNNGYTAVAGEVDELSTQLASVATQLLGSTRLPDNIAVSQPVFDAFYGYSLVQRRFLAILATKSCLPGGVICAALPTTARTAIKNSVVTLKAMIQSLADNFKYLMPTSAAVKIDGVSDTDMLLCDVVIGSYGGLVNFG